MARASTLKEAVADDGGDRAATHADRDVTVVTMPQAALRGIVHILTCGSVDDGKSTLIGRLLWDAGDLPDDQRDMVRRAALAAGTPDVLDYSLLLDGLVAEREQGITIDVAWRYMDTASRRFVIIDSPGHEQYTRNMASGASHADVAVMLIDARHGIKRQTRRHAAILDLMGVKRVVLAVNKMDLIGWDELPFRRIERDFAALSAELGFQEARTIPVSARAGDNVAFVSGHMPWYTGPTLVDHLDRIPGRLSAAGGVFRMPVQTVLRDGQDFRGLAGTVTSGRIHVGDDILDALTGRRARVARIATMDGDRDAAQAGQAVAIVLDRDLDIARGSVLSAPTAPLTRTDALTARLVWLADAPLDTDHGLMLATATDTVTVTGIEVTAQVNLDTLALESDWICGPNDIVDAAISLGRPIVLDRFDAFAQTGSFLLVDPVHGTTLAAGIVSATGATTGARRGKTFRLTRDILAGGVCAGLGGSAEDRVEFNRRARAVAALLTAAGITLDGEFA